MRPEGRRVRRARRAGRVLGRFVVKRLLGGNERRLGRARSERVERAARSDVLVPAGSVLDRMLEPRLPACQQRDDEKDPRETGEHRASSTYFAGTASVRR